MAGRFKGTLSAHVTVVIENPVRLALAVLAAVALSGCNQQPSADTSATDDLQAKLTVANQRLDVAAKRFEAFTTENNELKRQLKIAVDETASLKAAWAAEEQEGKAVDRDRKNTARVSVMLTDSEKKRISDIAQRIEAGQLGELSEPDLVFSHDGPGRHHLADKVGAFIESSRGEFPDPRGMWQDPIFLWKRLRLSGKEALMLRATSDHKYVRDAATYLAQMDKDFSLEDSQISRIRDEFPIIRGPLAEYLERKNKPKP